MSAEDKGRAPSESEATAHSNTGKKKKYRKKNATIAVIVVVAIVVLGIGMWTWHEQPSFCNAFCHDAMDTYPSTYEQQANAAGIDKWGNDVSNTNAMLAVTHREAGDNCLDCHVPTISQQLNEVSETITGNYYVPLAEVSTEELMVNSGHEAGTGDEFCLRSGCHDTLGIYTREDLTQATADMTRNPHSWQHGQQACSDCHKAHRASTLICTECHADAKTELPEGWVDTDTGNKIEEEAMSR